ncbi:PREDICTED: transcription factor A, mitochondrial-like [Branchiostoma belcheri]|uniref:Transcription factor A, mitochondrial-like n=1 Tax=Branchiostoma belcheri TaxID=7741 RepID=A0A6P4ZWI9_BRABE|nr:PREDICTED: transcription factor A, mitochondrial-like [Branchiostoma belcheri]
MAATTKLTLGVQYLLWGTKSSVSLGARPAAPLLQFSRCFVQSSSKFPVPPKRPANAYIRYVNQKMPSVRSQNPGAGQNEIVRICASLWKQLSDIEKQPYVTEAAAEREKYKSEYEDFKSDFTIEEWGEYQDSRRQRRQKLKNRRRREELHQLGKPKLPPHGYGLFVKDMLSGGSGNMAQQMKDMKGQWNNLAEAEKQKYMSEASKAKEKYDSEMQAWEKKMVEQGRPELVRGYRPKKTTAKKKKPKKKTIATKAAKKTAKRTTAKLAAKKKPGMLSSPRWP